MGIIKAHCGRHGKWFLLDIDESDPGNPKVVNFMNISEEQAKSVATDVKGTSFPAAASLRPCMKCGSRKAGKCSHIEGLGRCGLEYSYQCLFCNQLKISLGKAVSSRYTDWVGTNFIPGAKQDKYGNAQGSEYDLAKDDGFRGFTIVILCLYTGEGILQGMQPAIRALEKKGFTVKLKTEASPRELKSLLSDACQLWVISDRVRHLNDEHLRVIRDFYQQGHGLYLFGDNEPFYEDVNFLSQALLGTIMTGNTLGDKVIGVQNSAGTPGIIPGHPISTGIVNLYEGITIATVHCTSLVRPLVTSSERNVVTGIYDSNGGRALLDGGFTRLFIKWDTAGTDRFVVNAAAWLANAENAEGGEVSFT